MLQEKCFIIKLIICNRNLSAITNIGEVTTINLTEESLESGYDPNTVPQVA